MSFKSHKDLLAKSLESIDENEIENLLNILVNAYRNDHFIFIIGNGGSAANASHFAQDLSKGTRTSHEAPLRVKAMSLTDNTPFITAQANDEGYDTIFEQQLKTFSHNNDILIAISGSGNSPNIINAVEWANNNGLRTVGVTGYDGGKLKKLTHYNLHVSLNDMCTCESIHSVIFHYIILELRERFKSLKILS